MKPFYGEVLENARLRGGQLGMHTATEKSFGATSHYSSFPLVGVFSEKTLMSPVIKPTPLPYIERYRTQGKSIIAPSDPEPA